MKRFTYIISLLYIYFILFLYMICAIVGGSFILSTLFHIPIWIASIIFMCFIVSTVPILIWIDNL